MSTRTVDKRAFKNAFKKQIQNPLPNELNTMIKRTGMPPGRQALMRLFLTRLRRYDLRAAHNNQHVLHALAHVN